MVEEMQMTDSAFRIQKPNPLGLAMGYDAGIGACVVDAGVP